MPKRRGLPRRLRAELADPIHVAGVTYQQQFIQCSKPNCNEWHGPYWYAFYKVRETNRTKSKYIGRELPQSVIDAFREEADTPEATLREARREVRKRARAASRARA
jgi:hypothetical protein